MLISVIVPALNEEKVIETTLRQIHDNLTDFEHEIIVTDDGSKDRTVEIANRYGRVVFDPDPKRTIASNRNNGARNAKGEYLAFVDADMFIPEPNHFFRTLMGDFALDHKLVGATVKIEVLPEEANLWDRLIMAVTNRVQWFNNNVVHSGSASGEFQFMKREAFEKLGGYQKHLAVAEDNDLFLRLSKIGHTRIDMRLVAYNTGRRAHELGWPRVLWSWAVNYFYVRVFNRSHDKKWHRVG